MGEINSTQKRFISVFNNRLVRKAKAGETEETVTYTDSKKTVRTKTGVFIAGYSGIIKGLEIKQVEYEGSKFETLELSFQEGIEDVILTFGEKLMLSFLKIAPNVDYTKEIKLVPYTDAKGRQKLSAKQGEKLDVHVADFYHDFEAKTDKNGLELIEKPDDNDWTIYFAQVKKKLKKDFEKIVLPKFQKEVKPVVTQNQATVPPVVDNDSDDLPF